MVNQYSSGPATWPGLDSLEDPGMSTTKQQPKPVMNSISYLEIGSNNTAASKEFLAATFDWKLEMMKTPHGEFGTIAGPAGPIGSLRGLAPEEPSPSVTNYVSVADIEATVKAIEANGGKMLTPIREPPGMGKMAWFQEPGGCVFGLVQHATD